jgi:hypothetical protein
MCARGQYMPGFCAHKCLGTHSTSPTSTLSIPAAQPLSLAVSWQQGPTRTAQLLASPNRGRSNLRLCVVSVSAVHLIARLLEVYGAAQNRMTCSVLQSRGRNPTGRLVSLLAANCRPLPAHSRFCHSFNPGACLRRGGESLHLASTGSGTGYT